MNTTPMRFAPLDDRRIWTSYHPMRVISWTTGLAIWGVHFSVLFSSVLFSGAAYAADVDHGPWLAAQGRPLLTQFCFECHAGEDSQSELRLDHLLAGKAPGAPNESSSSVWATVAWHKIAERMRLGEMPPEDSPQPDGTTRDQFLGYVENQLARDLCDRPADPGRVTIRRLNRTEYRNTVRDLFGITRDVTAGFPQDNAGDGFDNQAEALTISPLLMEQYFVAAELIVAELLSDEQALAQLVTHHPRQLVDDRELTQESAAREVLMRLARRAFRRPIAAAQLDPLVALVQSQAARGTSYPECLMPAVQAILLSPRFLFRWTEDPSLAVPPTAPPDSAPPDSAQVDSAQTAQVVRPSESSRQSAEPTKSLAVHALDGHALATRVSYFLWSSMPDAALFQLAETGNLSQDAALQETVRRMLTDPRSQALIENFFVQWLELGLLDAAGPDPLAFPDFDDALRQAMRDETLFHCRHIVRENRSILEFLEAPYAFLNQRLAEHYQIAGVQGGQMRAVDVRDSGRGGLLTQAAVLTLTSHATRTSPVKRGKWILSNILGTPPPPPPPDVGALPDDQAEVEVVGTLRERLIAHQERAECAVCHVRMDNLGFGFERYDAVGAWREQDGGHAIDSAGVLPSGNTFQGANELRALLHAERADQFARCLAEKMLTFALGRELIADDRCTIDSILRNVQEDGYRMQTLIEQIVLSRPFRYQRPFHDQPTTTP